MRHRAALSIIVALVTAMAPTARAEAVRIASQYGLPYLPLTVMQERGFLVERGKQLGVALEFQLTRFTGGAPMNEALISGNLDFASGGLAPLLVVWDRTATSTRVRGVAALDMMPITLTTSNPLIHSVKDFTDHDRIAVPAARVSANAIVLEMAAAQAFGEKGWNRLEAEMVSMANPDAMTSLVNATAGITAHFAPEPYVSEELKNPKIHKIISSRDIIGDTYGFYAWSTTAYVQTHPKVVAAFLAALEDADLYIAKNPLDAAKIWIASEHASANPNDIAAILAAPENVWSAQPRGVEAFARFMSMTGLLHNRPPSDVFFEAPAR